MIDSRFNCWLAQLKLSHQFVGATVIRRVMLGGRELEGGVMAWSV